MLRSRERGRKEKPRAVAPFRVLGGYWPLFHTEDEEVGWGPVHEGGIWKRLTNKERWLETRCMKKKKKQEQ